MTEEDQLIVRGATHTKQIPGRAITAPARHSTGGTASHLVFERKARGTFSNDFARDDRFFNDFGFGYVQYYE